MTNPAFAHLRDTDDAMLGVGSLMDDLLGVEAAIEHAIDDDETVAATIEAAREFIPDWTSDLTDEEAWMLDRSVDTANTYDLEAA